MADADRERFACNAWHVTAYIDIVTAGGIGRACASADGCVVGSGVVVRERMIANRRIVTTGIVAVECLKSNGCVGVGLVNRESLLANRGVFLAGGVVMEREKTVGCVSVGTDVVRKRTMAGRRVELAGGATFEFCLLSKVEYSLERKPRNARFCGL